jgi:hypothetical protein
MGSVKFAVDHDRFVAKNRMMAAAEEGERKDRALEKRSDGQAPRKASCFNCRLKGKCPEFRANRTGYSTGAASFGGDQRVVCDKFDPAPNEKKGMSDKQIKSLLKNFRRSL